MIVANIRTQLALLVRYKRSPASQSILRTINMPPYEKNDMGGIKYV